MAELTQTNGECEEVRIGFIGLGTMGQPMAMRLANAGYSLTVHNRTRSKCLPLQSAGATVTDSPQAVAEASDVIITILPDSPDVKMVILGEAGIAAGAQAGMTIIDMSTIAPSVTRDIAKQLAKQDVHLLDAPVSGGSAGARAGTLSVMVGGEYDVFQECLPILEELGERIAYMGPTGAGQTTKLCNQIVGMLNVLATCEGLIFAARNGLNLEKVMDVIGAGAASSWQWKNTGRSMVARDLEPGFRVALAQKDIRLALDQAAQLDIVLPTTHLLTTLFGSLEANRHGESGIQALITVLEQLSGGAPIHDAT